MEINESRWIYGIRLIKVDENEDDNRGIYRRDFLAK